MTGRGMLRHWAVRNQPQKHPKAYIAINSTAVLVSLWWLALATYTRGEERQALFLLYDVLTSLL